MADDADRELYGLVEGDRVAFRVTASVDNDVEDLKQLVQMKKKGSLRDVDAEDLILWKVITLQMSTSTLQLTSFRQLHTPVPLESIQTILDLLSMQGSTLSQHAVDLDESMGDLSVIFPRHLPKDHLSLIVRVLPTPGEWWCVELIVIY